MNETVYTVLLRKQYQVQNRVLYLSEEQLKQTFKTALKIKLYKHYNT